MNINSNTKMWFCNQVAEISRGMRSTAPSFTPQMTHNSHHFHMGHHYIYPLARSFPHVDLPATPPLLNPASVSRNACAVQDHEAKGSSPAIDASNKLSKTVETSILDIVSMVEDLKAGRLVEKRAKRSANMYYDSSVCGLIAEKAGGSATSAAVCSDSPVLQKACQFDALHRIVDIELTRDATTQCNFSPARELEVSRRDARLRRREEMNNERQQMQNEDLRARLAASLSQSSTLRADNVRVHSLLDAAAKLNAVRLVENEEARRVFSLKIEALNLQLHRERKKSGDLESRLSAIKKSDQRVKDLEEKVALLTSHSASVEEIKKQTEIKLENLKECAAKEIENIRMACQIKDEETDRFKRAAKAASELAHTLRARMSVQDVTIRMLQSALMQAKIELESGAAHDSVFVALNIMMEKGRSECEDDSAHSLESICDALQSMWTQEFGSEDSAAYVTALEALKCSPRSMPLSFATRNTMCMAMCARDTLLSASALQQAEPSRSSVHRACMYACGVNEKLLASSPILRWTEQCIEKPTAAGVGILACATSYMEQAIESTKGALAAQKQRNVYDHISEKTMHRYESSFSSLASVSPCPDVVLSCIAGAVGHCIAEAVEECGYTKWPMLQARRLMSESNMMLMSTWARVRPDAVAAAIATRVTESKRHAVIHSLACLTSEVRVHLKSMNFHIVSAKEGDGESLLQLLSLCDITDTFSAHSHVVNELCVVYDSARVRPLDTPPASQHGSVKPTSRGRNAASKFTHSTDPLLFDCAAIDPRQYESGSMFYTSNAAVSLQAISDANLEEKEISAVHAYAIQGQVEAMHVAAASYIRPACMQALVSEACTIAAMSACALRQSAAETIDKALKNTSASSIGVDVSASFLPMMTHTHHVLDTTCALLAGGTQAGQAGLKMDLLTLVKTWETARYNAIDAEPSLAVDPRLELPVMSPDSCKPQKVAGSHSAPVVVQTEKKTMLKSSCVLYFKPCEALVESMSDAARIQLASCVGSSGLDTRGSAARERAARKLRKKKIAAEEETVHLSGAGSGAGGNTRGGTSATVPSAMPSLVRKHFTEEELKATLEVTPEIHRIFKHYNGKVTIASSFFNMNDLWKKGPITKLESNSHIFVHRVEFNYVDVEIYLRISVHASVENELEKLHAFVLHVVRGIVQNMRRATDELSTCEVDDIRVFKGDDATCGRMINVTYLVEKLCVALNSTVEPARVREYVEELRTKMGIADGKVAVVPVRMCQW